MDNVKTVTVSVDINELRGQLYWLLAQPTGDPPLGLINMLEAMLDFAEEK